MKSHNIITCLSILVILTGCISREEVKPAAQKMAKKAIPLKAIPALKAKPIQVVMHYKKELKSDDGKLSIVEYDLNDKSYEGFSVLKNYDDIFKINDLLASLKPALETRLAGSGYQVGSSDTVLDTTITYLAANKNVDKSIMMGYGKKSKWGNFIKELLVVGRFTEVTNICWVQYRLEAVLKQGGNVIHRKTYDIYELEDIELSGFATTKAGQAYERGVQMLMKSFHGKIYEFFYEIGKIKQVAM